MQYWYSPKKETHAGCSRTGAWGKRSRSSPRSKDAVLVLPQKGDTRGMQFPSQSARVRERESTRTRRWSTCCLPSSMTWTLPQ
jgi:hypothetical protein